MTAIQMQFFCLHEHSHGFITPIKPKPYDFMLYKTSNQNDFGITSSKINWRKRYTALSSKRRVFLFACFTSRVENTLENLPSAAVEVHGLFCQTFNDG